MKKPILPPTYFYIALFLMLVLHFHLPWFTWLVRPWTYLGLIPFMIGVALNVMADTVFKREGTTVKPHEIPTELMTDGAFSISRHPMYLGFELVLTGIWIFMGTFTPLLPVIALGLVLDLGFIPLEENMLCRQFGDTYDAYAAVVRKWIGRF